jgi:VWFA-related protein
MPKVPDLSLLWRLGSHLGGMFVAARGSGVLMPRRRLACVSVCALGRFLLVDAFAQDRSVPSFPARSDIVTVDVVVLGKDGRSVRGLRQGDFTLLEDGHPEAIAAFEARDLKASRPPDAAAAAVGLPAPEGATEEAPGRTLAFIVDDLGLDSRCTAAMESIRTWIRDKADPRDQVTLATASRKVNVTERIGSGRGALLRTLQGLRCGEGLRDVEGLWQQYLFASGQQDCHRDITSPDAKAENAMAWCLNAQQVVSGWRIRARALIGAIEGFARAHASERGRKSAFVFTQSFIRDDDLEQAEEAVEVAHRTNTALYFIDPRGLVGVNALEVTHGMDLAGAAHMAAETGGVLISSNDVGSLAQAIDESEAYYLLGYVPQRPPDRKWRELQVKVARPGVKVRSRRGYLASAEPAPEPGDPTLAQASHAERPAAPPASARAALATPPSRAGDPLDGTEIVRNYRDAIESYRRHDPANSAEGQALVLQAARWDLNLARLAAMLAAMPPPDVTTRVHLDGDEGGTGGSSPRNRRDDYLAATAASRAASQNPGTNDAAENAFAGSRGSRLAAEAAATGAAASREDRVRLSATVAPLPAAPATSDAQLRGGESATSERTRAGWGPRGACLIDKFADQCAEILKAAALLHTDVATLELARGELARAATHRAIAGWLLWHLPRKAEMAEDDAFARDWLLAVDVLLRGAGSLSGARQLGQLGLGRFPKDDALLLSTATATETLATLCYGADGTPLGGADCFEIPVAFDAPQPSNPLLRNGRPVDRGQALRESETLLRTLAARRPADPEVRLRLGHVLSRRGRPQEAQRELRFVVDNAADTNQIALARLLLWRLAEARQDLQDALDQAHAAQRAAPSSQSVRMALAHALLAHGDREDAPALMAALPQEPPRTRDPWAELLFGSTASYAPARAALYARVRLP